MKITDFLRDTKGEFKHVNWPTQRQAILFTLTVIVLSLLTALILGAFDSILGTLLDKFVI